MRECRVIVPTHNNVGNALTYEHNEFQVALINAFGGFTRTLGLGGWRADNGNIVQEEIAIYDIAVEDSPASVKLRIFSMELLKTADQDAIYFRGPDGTVELLTA